jgi:methylated-DNA-[protein]-cysteine S-methyltransferase
VTATDFDAVVSLPCACVGIRIDGEAVTDISFLPAGSPERAPATPLAARAVDEIRAYARDPAHPIDLPLAIAGNAFQRAVWEAISRIPSGATRTYGELAAQIGGTARAVGQACGDNRLPLAIPCHRIVGAAGMGGFAHRSDGAMTDLKRWLLAHESRAVFALTPR